MIFFLISTNYCFPKHQKLHFYLALTEADLADKVNKAN